MVSDTYTSPFGAVSVGAAAFRASMMARWAATVQALAHRHRSRCWSKVWAA
jgi:hypothetical protein